MSRILLADDSAHAQRMGVRILREEGFEVVSVTDGETAAVRLADVDPDIVLADVFLPGKSGLELCRLVRESPRHRRARVVLTAGILETFDEEAAKQAGCDAILRKPFEASAVVSTVRSLIDQAAAEPPPVPVPVETMAEPAAAPAGVVPVAEPESSGAAAQQPQPSPPAAVTPDLDPERVRAAVTVALDAAFPSLVDEITGRVVAALSQRP